MPGGGTPHLYKGDTPLPRATRGGWGDHALKKIGRGVGVPLIFGSGGCHPGLAEGGTPMNRESLRQVLLKNSDVL